MDPSNRPLFIASEHYRTNPFYDFPFDDIYIKPQSMLVNTVRKYKTPTHIKGTIQGTL